MCISSIILAYNSIDWPGTLFLKNGDRLYGSYKNICKNENPYKAKHIQKHLNFELKTKGKIVA